MPGFHNKQDHHVIHPLCPGGNLIFITYMQGINVRMYIFSQDFSAALKTIVLSGSLEPASPSESDQEV